MSVVRVRDEASRVLHRYFDPLVGGPNGKGWPWGRPDQSGEAYRVLQQIRGVDFVEESACSAPTRSPVSGDRRRPSWSLPRTCLVFSYEHQIRVVEP